MGYRLEFEIPGLPRMTNPSGRGTHWAVRMAEARKWKKLVALAVGSNRPAKPLEKAKLTLTRYSAKCPDADGLVSGFKHVIDGLVECGVLEDDRFSNIGMPDYRWKKAPMKKGRISVLIEQTLEAHYTHENSQHSVFGTGQGFSTQAGGNSLTGAMA